MRALMFDDGVMPSDFLRLVALCRARFLRNTVYILRHFQVQSMLFVNNVAK